MPLRLLFALFITLSFCQKSTAQFVWSTSAQNEFYTAMSNAILVKDTTTMRSLLQKNRNKEGVLTFRQQVLFHLALKEYDELVAWLPTASLPDSSADEYSYYSAMRNRAGLGKKDAWFNGIVDGIATNISDFELRDLLTICIIHEQLAVRNSNAAFHADYNRKVIRFLQTYPYSRFRTIVGTVLNGEVEAHGSIVYYDLGVGAFVQTNTTEDQPINYWEAPSFNVKVGFGYKKNLFSLWAMFANMDEFPETIEEQGPFNELFYRQIMLRYDRQLYERKHLDLYAFGGFGAGGHAFSNREDDEEEEAFEKWFPSGSAGIRIDVSPVVRQNVVGVDKPFSHTKYFIGIEAGVSRNFYSFMDNYQSMLYVSLNIGTFYRKTAPRPNSAFY